MKPSRGSAAFAALLALSLAVKLVASTGDPSPDPTVFAGRAAAMLRAGGFRVMVQPRMFGFLVYGLRGECRTMLGEYAAHGTFAVLIGEAARPIGQLRYRYRDRVYPDPPKAAPLIDFYLVRELRRVGVAARRHPVMAVAASPACDLRALDWRPLASTGDRAGAKRPTARGAT